jgi:hypothetical protein
MKFVRYTVEDFGKVFSTYPEFFTQHNLNKKFYNFGANILPPKVEVLASYERKLRFDEEIEDANDASSDFKKDPALEKILKKDWILLSEPLPHESYDYIICAIMKDFRVGENQAFFPYCRPQKLLIEAKGIKEQNEFKGFNNIWEKTL